MNFLHAKMVGAVTQYQKTLYSWIPHLQRHLGSGSRGNTCVHVRVQELASLIASLAAAIVDTGIRADSGPRGLK